MNRTALISGRAEACFERIALTLSAPRPADAAGGYAQRDQVLTNLRAIKQKASEAEALLRSLDHSRGCSSRRAPAFPAGDTVSQPEPAPTSTEQP